MSADFLAHAAAHVALSAGALAVALAIGLPLGSWIAKHEGTRAPLLAAINTARVVPSLAVLMLMLPLIGVGTFPALVALALLAIPPIAVNTDLGLRSVPFAVLDAGRGLGMSPRELARRVEWPLALPVAFAGIRTAGVEVVASATLAAFIGGGGLGEYITEGLSVGNDGELLLGAVSVALLALAVDAALAAIGRRLAARS